MSEDSTIQEPPPALPTTSSGLPATLQYSRYAALGKKSPFTLASSTEQTADFAKDLFLAGFVRLGGEEFVLVANKTKADRVLVGKKISPSAQGMVLVEVKKDSSGDPSKLEAKIKKGNEVAFIKYEGTGGGAVLPMATGQPPTPVPNNPNLPGVQPQNGQSAGGQGQKQVAPVIRRRVTPIPSGGNR
jgi:hypothetical protein